MVNMADDTIECGNCGAIVPISSKRCPKCSVLLFEEQADQIFYAGSTSIHNDQTQKAILRKSEIRKDTQTNKNNTVEIINPVTIINFDMPFWSIVAFMIKVAIASIPATIVILVIYIILWLIFGGLLKTVFG